MVLIPYWVRNNIFSSLVFLLLVIACKRSPETGKIELVWEGQRATSLRIPYQLLPANAAGDTTLHVRLANHGERDNIIGTVIHDSDWILFTPMIPFTAGLRYDVVWGDSLVGTINVMDSNEHTAPEVVAVYPSQDTVPQNLLKVYVRFSQPMREGHALDHIVLLKHNKDTVAGAFLELHPELWSADQKTITLWLDPGRIKRDLQPNLRLGTPLEPETSYTIIVQTTWSDTAGNILADAFKKNFFIAERDETSPRLEDWTIKLPGARTENPLIIEFRESLDRVLLEHAIQIRDSHDNLVDGSIRLTNSESRLEFFPSHSWNADKYKLIVESRLEDLAGNNLNRLFDRDITIGSKVSDATSLERVLEIR